MNPRLSLENALKDPDFVDLSDLPNLRIDLRYGTKNNVLGKDVYGGFQRVLLHKIAADKFRKASALLAKHHPELRFVIFDALRPQSAQIEFWNLVKDTPQQPYFSNPEKGSIHSYGFAIDLGLVDKQNRELDMGTEFDDLSPLAEPQKEKQFLAEGKLSCLHLQHRLILRNTMEEAGFLQLPHEWWHYDAMLPAEVRARFRRLA